MNTITLPPLPERSKHTSLWEYTDGQMDAHARAAVELDRQSRGAPVAAQEPVNLIFSGEGPNLTFVEAEDDAGKGVSVGEWSRRGEYLVLRLNAFSQPPTSAQPAVSAEPWHQELIALLQTIRPTYGDVGSRDVDVAAQQKRIDRAIAMLAAPVAAQPSMPTQIAVAKSDPKPSGTNPPWTRLIIAGVEVDRSGDAAEMIEKAARINHNFASPTPPADEQPSLPEGWTWVAKPPGGFVADAQKADGQAQQDAAFEAGWRTAAVWAERSDLVSDIGSAPYERDKQHALCLAGQRS